jgi:hypothetical protein
VTKPSIVSQTSKHIREFILVKDFMNMKNVVNLLPIHQKLCMQESTLERNPTSVNIVINILIIPQDCFCIRESTLERNHTNVKIVTNPSVNAHTLKDIREFIQERNHTNV